MMVQNGSLSQQTSDLAADDTWTNGSSSSNGDSTQPEAIAIVGMGMRLPGGIHQSRDLWDLLVNGRNARSPIPTTRFNAEAFSSLSGKPGTTKMKEGYFLSEEDSLDRFDASFVQMSKAEVERLDPQQRMLLEVVYECMENAGQQKWRGDKIGCYVGTFGEDFQDLGAKDTMNTGLYRVGGAGDWALSNRISWAYNLKGPSMTVQTACSSSLVAVHHAIRAIRAGDCSSAIVAASNLIITPTMSIAMTEQGVLSSDGRCKTFDASADGYARGEAINAIYLKPLSAAVRDDDPIRAVIRGSAINCDGMTEGFSTPSGQAHEEMIRHAYQEAQLDLHDTAYIECHGTGTKVGDRTETTAIARCFATPERPLYIGSVKPNLGHSEGASGLSSVMKVVLALEKGLIPPNVNFTTPNPEIPWHLNLKVPLSPTRWPTSPIRASINSFGIGGSNAHLILESAASFGIVQPQSPRTLTINRLQSGFNKQISTKRSFNNSIMNNGQLTPPSDQTTPHLVLLTAHKSTTLKNAIKLHSDYALANPFSLKQLAYTLATHREHLAHRTFAIAHREQPPSFISSVKVDTAKGAPTLTFVFTGQGAQWAGMGRELIQDHPTFRNDIWMMNHTLQTFSKAPKWNIKDELLKSPEKSRIGEAEFSQPLCTAVQVAMVNLLARWGIKPKAVIGHSSGEIAAGYAAGCLTMQEAIIAAFLRGQGVKTSNRKGGMTAVGLGRTEVTPYLHEGVKIGCENSPESVTLSGDIEALEKTEDSIRLHFPNTLVRRLKVEMAYHSHHMLEYGESYEATLSNYLQPKAPQGVTFYSSAEGKLITEETLGPAYWRKNLEQPVLFNQAASTCIRSESAHQLFLEVGPSGVLGGPLRQTLKAAGRENVGYVSCLSRGKNCSETMLKAIAEMWTQGVDINFSKVFGPSQVLTDLPLYSWNHDSPFWFESRISKDWRLRKFPRHEILGCRTLESTGMHVGWRNILRLEEVPWIRDHKVIDDIVFPFAGYVAMIGEAVRQLTGVEQYTLRNITVTTALVLFEGKAIEMTTNLSPIRLTASTNSSWWDFQIASFHENDSGGDWISHANGRVTFNEPGNVPEVSIPNIEYFPREVKNPYVAMKTVGLNYGPAFQGLQDVTALPNNTTASASLTLPEDIESLHDTPYAVHPATIDHCLQLLLAANSDGLARRVDKLFVPTSIDELYIGGRHGAEILRALAKATVVSTGLTGDVIALAGKEIALSLKHGHFSALESEVDSKNPDPVAAARVNYKPDLDFVSASSVIKATSASRMETEKLERFALLCMAEIKARIAVLKPASSAMEQFHSWLVWQVTRASSGVADLVPDAKELVSCDAKVRAIMLSEMRSGFSADTACYPAVELIIRVLDNIVDIISGTKGAIDILLPDDGLTHYYNYLADRTNARQWFELAAHQNPGMRILEIGAGTGGTTEAVLHGFVDAVGDGQGRFYGSYTFTDISSGFFPAAKERFLCHEMSYEILDITKDPIEQGFESEGYDLIVAANVLHATPNLRQTLTNVRKLLAPKGRLFLQELSPQAKAVNLIMGTLPGWWLGAEDDRSNEPYVGVERWDKELKAAGFNGVESTVYDDVKPYHMNANIIARPSPSAQPVSAGKERHLTLLTDPASDEDTTKLIDAFEEALVKKGYLIDFCTLSDTPKKGQDVISLLELTKPFFANLNSTSFQQLKSFIGTIGNSGLLWVTGSSRDPRFGMSLGISRTLRYELSMAFATIQIFDLSEAAIDSVPDVFQKFEDRDITTEVSPEYEWMIGADGEITIGRYNTVRVSEEMEDEGVRGEVRLEMGKTGLVQTLLWAPFDLANCGADEVVIQTQAAGLNCRDIMISQGIIPGSLGFEGAGTVQQTGRNVKHLSTGDRVMMLGTDCFSTTSILPAAQAIRIPDSMSWEEAATMPFAFATAIQALVKVAQLEQGQSVLIHSATSAVGLAAMQICRNVVGAEIFATVDDDEDKIQYIVSHIGIPRDHIFSSTKISFLNDVLAATGGNGVDLVLNDLTGDLLHASWEAVAEDGKMVELGKKDMVGKGQIRIDLMEANRALMGVDVSRLKPAKLQGLLQTTMEMFKSGKIKPLVIAKAYDSDDVEDAFRFANQATYVGKIVVRLPKEEESDNTIYFTPKPFKLSAEKSYLLVGGLGGLGRSIATYLAENGARHLMFLGRSAGNSAEDKVFVRELESQGCKVQLVQGDVSKMYDVRKCVMAAAKPIGGVFQLSMVLRDSNFLNMSHDDWQTAVAPKVQGTYNLHECLGKGLDFFVGTSSISGAFGNAGQANYAAANTFLGTFCAWRHNLGLPCSVIDVGVVGDIGYVANKAALHESLKNAGNYILREQDVLEAVRWAILSGHPGQQSHLAIGIRTTKPLADDACRSVWKRDRRMLAYRNREGSMGDTASLQQPTSPTSQSMAGLIPRLSTEPALLDDPVIKASIREEIGRKIYALMLQPAEEELDLGVTLSQLGVDSLVAIEVRNWIRRVTSGVGAGSGDSAAGGVECSTLELMGVGSLGAVGDLVLKGLREKISAIGA